MTAAPDQDTGAELWRPVLPRTPRQPAVDQFQGALMKQGLSEAAAAAMAGAVTDPDDARRRLAEPARIRVQGGTLLVIDVVAWALALAAYPANPRELGQRRYRAGGGTGDREGIYQTLRSARDRHAELAVTVSKPNGMADRLREAEQWLLAANNLVDDISVEGVLQPAVVSALSVAHRDKSEPLTILAAIDGSSRTSAVHRILDVKDPGELAYDTAPGTVALRQMIGRYLRATRQDWDELDASEQARARALTMPMRLIIGYEPSLQQRVPYDVAIRNLVGLIHISPPRRYGTHVENRAKADAVLDHLQDTFIDGERYLSPDEAKWFRGDLTAEEALAAGLSGVLDVRAADIARALLHGSNRTARHVNDGIRALTAKQSPTRNDRIDLIVELALRPLQAAYGVGSEDALAPRRAALQRAYRLPGIADELFGGPIWEGLPNSPMTLAELRDTALDEHANPNRSGRLQTAQIELAVKAAFYMITAETMALRREGYGVSTGQAAEDKSIPALLQNMLNRRQGIYQAVAIIEAGRQGEPLVQVKDNGSPVRVNRKPVPLTDALVRHLYAQAPLSPTDIGLPGAQARWEQVLNAVDAVDAAVESMWNVSDDAGHRYVEHVGWDPEQIATLRIDRIDRIDRRLASWADFATQLAAESQVEQDAAQND